MYCRQDIKVLGKNMLSWNLSAFRKAKNMTQESLASDCFVSVSTISNIEQRRVSPKASTLNFICFSMGIPTSMLFSDFSLIDDDFAKRMNIVKSLSCMTIGSAGIFICSRYGVMFCPAKKGFIE